MYNTVILTMPDRSVSLPMSRNTGPGWKEKSSGQRREKERETEVSILTLDIGSVTKMDNFKAKTNICRLF